jgi:hypothetical protein
MVLNARYKDWIVTHNSAVHKASFLLYGRHETSHNRSVEVGGI